MADPERIYGSNRGDSKNDLAGDFDPTPTELNNPIYVMLKIGLYNFFSRATI